MRIEHDGLDRAAWAGALGYLRQLAAHEYEAATDTLQLAIDREGIGAMGDALSDVCRSLTDRITFEAGTVDVHTIVERIARRVVTVAEDTTRDALDHQRALIVFLGSEGLPCVARTDVATWSPVERLRALVACTIGLLGIVAEDDGCSILDTVGTITEPGDPGPAPGTFGLAWRGCDAGKAEALDGVVPSGYTAHITFLGSGPCSLRAIFARVAGLRDLTADSASPPQFTGAPTPPEPSRSS